MNDVWCSGDFGESWEEVLQNEFLLDDSSTTRFLNRGYLHGFETSDGGILVMGGTDLVDCFNDVWKSVDGGLNWRCLRRNMSVSAIPSLFSSGSSSSKNWSARYGFWAATNEINDVIMIGGGCTLNNTVFSDAYISLDDGETWKRVAKQMSKKKAEGIVHAQAAIIGSQLFVFGGTPSTTTHYGTDSFSKPLTFYFSSRVGDEKMSFNRVMGEQWGRFEGSAISLDQKTLVLIGGLVRGDEEIKDGKEDDEDSCRVVDVFKIDDR